ncbi:MAG: rubredoxin [Clostridia bacterium]|jgi:rubredoxin|nr:rubredoxin [Clostridia bacterium]
MTENQQKLYQCQMQSCGYIYNPEKGCKKGGIARGVCFENLPETYKCPLCKAGKKMFKVL